MRPTRARERTSDSKEIINERAFLADDLDFDEECKSSFSFRQPDLHITLAMMSTERNFDHV